MFLRNTVLIPAALVISLAVTGTSAQRGNAGSITTTTESPPEEIISTTIIDEPPAAVTTTSVSLEDTATPLPAATRTNSAKLEDITTTALPDVLSSDNGALIGLPTLTGGFVFVEPSVPPTQNAPFMQQSSLPEGTVFIVVGSILGFFALGILVWRMGIAWCLHRSVQKAALNQGMADTKALFRTTTAPTAPFYKYSDRESSLSLPRTKGAKKVSKSGTVPAAASTANLFFSPTAGAVGANHAPGSNRGSSYFPAGFYAAGPGNSTNQGGSPAIGLSNLSPQTQNYRSSRSIDIGPLDSPHMSQTPNLNEKAPSAYLDNLFDGEGASPLPPHGHQRQGSRI